MNTFSAINALSYGLLLFLLGSGITVIYSLMGVFNFAHGAFYMLGAYIGFSISLFLTRTFQLNPLASFVAALVFAPLIVALIGAIVEQQLLRRLYSKGQIAQLLTTIGIAYIASELVQLCWGRAPLPDLTPEFLRLAIHLDGTSLPLYRFFIIATALLVLLVITLLFRYARIGLIVRATLTHPMMARSLGYQIDKVRQIVFAIGCALAALAGVVASTMGVIEPSMSMQMGSMAFIIVILGGLGSIKGAFFASLLIGALHSYSITLNDYRLSDLMGWHGFNYLGFTWWSEIGHLALGQVALALPFLLMFIILLVRPHGFFGHRKE